MQKRESFYAELSVLPYTNWMPAPREYSTLTYCNRRCFLMGGLNYDTNREVAQLKIINDTPTWTNIEYTA